MKKGIIVLIIIILCSGIYLYFRNHNSDAIQDRSENISNEQYDYTEYTPQYENSNKLQKVSNLIDYYTVRACLIKYYTYCCSVNGESELEQEEALNYVYMLLDSKYVDEFGITLDSLKEKITLKDDVDVNIEELLYITENNIYVYFIKGNLRNLVTGEYIDMNLALIQDRNNNTYSMLLDDYVEKMEYNKLKEGKKLDFDYPNEIKANDINKYSPHSMTSYEYVKDFIAQIREDLLYNPQRAYELLSKESKKQYSNYDEFVKFIQDNKKDIFTLTYESHTLDYEKEQPIFVCKDKYNSFTIRIRAEYPTEYTYSIVKN